MINYQPINKVGKKGKAWIKARAKLVKEAIIEGRIVVRQSHGFPEGYCEDCNKWRQLDLDHIKKRSQGGLDTKENVAYICRSCHIKRDNQGDPMKKKITRSSKKAIWEQSHECRYCKRTVSMFLCPFCHKKSI
ncbi:HNH endonuclease [bacterium]|nr:HNH endonuclease [bacterium]